MLFFFYIHCFLLIKKKIVISDYGFNLWLVIMVLNLVGDYDQLRFDDV